MMNPAITPGTERRLPVQMMAAGARSADPLRGRDLLCFSHDWNGDPLSKNHLMRILARQNRILWINSIGYRRPTASWPMTPPPIPSSCMPTVPG